MSVSSLVSCALIISFLYLCVYLIHPSFASLQSILQLVNQYHHQKCVIHIVEQNTLPISSCLITIPYWNPIIITTDNSLPSIRFIVFELSPSYPITRSVWLPTPYQPLHIESLHTTIVSSKKLLPDPRHIQYTNLTYPIYQSNNRHHANPRSVDYDPAPKQYIPYIRK